MKNEDFLNLQELVQELNVSESTVRRWTKKGLLPHLLTPSQQFTYKRSDIDAFKKRYPMYVR